MRFRTNYDRDIPEGEVFTEPSRTKQSDLEASDINNVMSRYALQQEALINPREFLTGDFSELQSYQEDLDRLSSARARFDALPVDIRRRFDFNPQALVDFILNPANREECIAYGFIDKPVSPTNSVVVQPAQPAEPAEPAEPAQQG